MVLVGVVYFSTEASLLYAWLFLFNVVVCLGPRVQVVQSVAAVPPAVPCDSAGMDSDLATPAKISHMTQTASKSRAV